jgi:aminoglycoside phosphotransferase (APT) family kinase protein
MSAIAALPESELARYLERAVAGFRGPLTATKFEGGQSNPTYRIDATSGRYVLRRKPPGPVLSSAHAVDREYRVLRALYGSAVPVAEPLHLCTDASVIGSDFYLMSYVEGRVFWDPALPDLTPTQRAPLYGEMARVLAALHGVDVDRVGLSDYGKPGNYFARQIARWSDQYRASETERIDAIEHLIAWLPAHCPPDDGVRALVHGDFRLDNLMFARDGVTVLAVVDWELSTLGHPLADLAYWCMTLRLPRNPLLPGLGGTDRAALSIPDERALIESYRMHAGRGPIENWNFYLAFSYFRLAAIAQGVLKRALQGNASSEHAHGVGRMAGLVAAAGAALAA